MSKHFDPTAGWIVTCDWPDCGKQYIIGLNGAKYDDFHFQCGSHHGIIPQKDKPEFQLPEDVEVKEDVVVGTGDKTNE